MFMNSAVISSMNVKRGKPSLLLYKATSFSTEIDSHIVKISEALAKVRNSWIWSFSTYKGG